MASSAHTPSEWLSRTAERIGVADPTRFFGDSLEAAFSAPLGDPGYAPNALLPGVAPLEVSFSEAMPKSLRFDFEPGWRGTHEQLRSIETEALIRCVARCFGLRAAGEFGARATTLSDRAPGAAFDLFVGAASDARGLREVKAYYPLDRASTPLVSAAKEELPALRELMHSVAIRRDGLLAERAYLVCMTDLELFSLEPLLERFGLGHRVPELVTVLLRLTGDSFVLPPKSCVLGLRSVDSAGIEVKVEILVGSIHLAADLAVIATLFAERPPSGAAFNRWLEAISLPGAELRPSVVSARVTDNAPLSINVYAHPVVERSAPNPSDERELAPLLG